MAELIRVRIAVAVNHRKEWSSAGWHSADDDTAVGTALSNLDGNEGDTEEIVWVEADVPVPEVKIVEGVVNATVQP